MRPLLLISLAFLLGCKDQSPPLPTVNGTWTGTTSTDLLFTLTMAQSSAGDVPGTGSIVTSDETIAITLDGTYVAPTLSVNGSSDNFETFNYAGTHAGSTITGNLNGSGFQTVR